MRKTCGRGGRGRGVSYGVCVCVLYALNICIICIYIYMYELFIYLYYVYIYIVLRGANIYILVFVCLFLVCFFCCVIFFWGMYVDFWFLKVSVCCWLFQDVHGFDFFSFGDACDLVCYGLF